MKQNLGLLKSLETELHEQLDSKMLTMGETVKVCADILRIRSQIRTQESIKGIGNEDAERNQKSRLANKGYDFSRIDYPDPDIAAG